MSMRESRFSIRATSFGSVSPATEQTVTFVCVRRPDGLARKPQLRRAQMPAGPRAVLIRIVSVNASFAPLTVFSLSGAEGPRRVPLLASKQSALASPGKTTTQYPCVSLSAAASAESASSHTAHQTAPRCACAYNSSGVPGRRFSISGRTTKSEMSLPGRHAVEKERIEHLPARRQLPQAKIVRPVEARLQRRKHPPPPFSFAVSLAENGKTIPVCKSYY